MATDVMRGDYIYFPISVAHYYLENTCELSLVATVDLYALSIH